MTVRLLRRLVSLAPWMVVIVALGLFTIGIQAVALARPSSSSPEEGQKVFQQMCSSCHTIGGGKMVGPDLKGITQTQNEEWLTNFISAPDQMIASGDARATELLKEYNNIPMPNLGLTPDQVASLIAYLATTGPAPAPTPTQSQAPGSTTPSSGTPVPVGTLSPGNPQIGEELFTGQRMFQNDGSSCMACHSVAGAGSLGGGVMGPDLTNSYSRLGDAMMAWPQTMVPMKDIYTSKSLTEQEKVHLLAFFKDAAAKQAPSRSVVPLVGLATSGLVVLLVVAQFIWRGRSRGVRKPMISGSSSRKS